MANSNELKAYKEKLKLSDIQREVLVGLLLGDGHLETANSGKTYRLKIEQSEKHKSYVKHLYHIFEDWVLTEPNSKDKVRNGNKSV